MAGLLSASVQTFVACTVAWCGKSTTTFSLTYDLLLTPDVWAQLALSFAYVFP